MTPGLDKLSWRYLKRIVKDNACFNKFIDIVYICIDIGYWLSYFKVLTIIIIPKSNKESYDFSKIYWPIVLLNTISQLFEKVISERLQFMLISNNFIHLCQLKGLKQWSIINAGVVLIYFIYMGWIKNLTTSTLAFDIVYFFPSLNHQLSFLNTSQSWF